jgi:ribosomal protein S5
VVGRRCFSNSREEIDMTKLWAVLLVLASFVLVAPVVESGTSSALNLFVAVGNADGGAGGE